MSRPYSRFLPLTNEDIENTLTRFEEMYERWKNDGVIGRPCEICNHQRRIEINRAILNLVRPRVILKEFGLKGNFHTVGYHQNKHLAIVTVFNKNTVQDVLPPILNVVARQPFPFTKGFKAQLRWCLNQFVVLKEVELEKLAGRVNPYIELPTKDYENAVLRIRETIVMLQKEFEKPKDRRGRHPKDVTPERPEWVSAESEAELAKAEEHRQKQAKNTLEKMIKEGRINERSINRALGGDNEDGEAEPAPESGTTSDQAPESAL